MKERKKERNKKANTTGLCLSQHFTVLQSEGTEKGAESWGHEL